MKESHVIPQIPEYIDPRRLLTDNRSEAAKNALEAWRRAKGVRALIGVHTCGDARVVPTTIFDSPTFIEISSIAAATPVESFTYAMRHSGVMASMVLGHFAGDSIDKKGYAAGCGGLHERSRLSQSDSSIRKGDVEGYIIDHVASPDVVIQTITSAAQMAKVLEKPVIAAAVDHLSNMVHPLAVITNGGHNIISAVSLKDVFDKSNGGFYKDGRFPTLTKEQLSSLTGTQLDFFLYMLAVNQESWSGVSDQFINGQRVQDPTTIALTTDVRPIAIRYPETFGEANRVFSLSLPYIKNERGEVTGIDEKGLLNVRAQLQYALNHAASAHEGDPFFRTVNLIIETPSIKMSREALETLLADSTLNAWQKSRDGKIILAEVKGGVTKNIQIAYMRD